MELAVIFVLALLVEALVEYAKLIFVDRAINWKQIVALGLGVALAVLAGVDMLQWFGITFIVPYAGMVLTGILFSRGANYLADIVKRIQGLLNGGME